jgi:hypothetical protein
MGEVIDESSYLGGRAEEDLANSRVRKKDVKRSNGTLIHLNSQLYLGLWALRRRLRGLLA